MLQGNAIFNNSLLPAHVGIDSIDGHFSSILIGNASHYLCLCRAPSSRSLRQDLSQSVSELLHNKTWQVSLAEDSNRIEK